MLYQMKEKDCAKNASDKFGKQLFHLCHAGQVYEIPVTKTLTWHFDFLLRNF